MDLQVHVPLQKYFKRGRLGSTRIVEFIQEAEAEMEAAVEWYEAQEPGLGRRLLFEIKQTSELIAENPKICRLREGGYRRANCPVFPFFLPYVIRKNLIFILAVAHVHREPNYWKNRI